MVSAAPESSTKPRRAAVAAERQRLLEDFRIESIQRAAVEVISRKGIAGATMQEIADAAGISKGTLYLYFKDREAVVESAVDRALGRLMAALEEVFADDAPLATVLPALLERHFAFFDGHQVLFRVYRALLGEVAAENYRRCNAHYHRYLAQLRALFERAIARGEIEAVDTDRLATFFSDGTRGMILRRILLDEAPPEPASDAALIANLLLRGLLTGRSRS